MRLAGILALLGLGCLVAAAVRGELDFHLFLVFPVITGTGPLGVLGVLLLMAAGVAAFFGAARRAVPFDEGMGARDAYDVPPGHVRYADDAQKDTRREPGEPRAGASRVRHGGGDASEASGAMPWRRRHGGIVLLGPFPIVWGGDRGMAKGLVVLAIVLAAIVLAIMLLPLTAR